MIVINIGLSPQQRCKNICRSDSVLTNAIELITAAVMKNFAHINLSGPMTSRDVLDRSTNVARVIRAKGEETAIIIILLNPRPATEDVLCYCIRWLVYGAPCISQRAVRNQNCAVVCFCRPVCQWRQHIAMALRHNHIMMCLPAGCC